MRHPETGATTMKNITRHTGTLELVKRLNNSASGNPRFQLRCDGWTFITQPDCMVAYMIENYIGKRVIVTVGTHYGKCQLKSLTHDGYLTFEPPVAA
jgi:hypothetical protein